MLNLLIRGSIAIRRCKTEYVLAKVVDGKLVEAEFDRMDKQFSYTPKITASGTLLEKIEWIFYV